MTVARDLLVLGLAWTGAVFVLLAAVGIVRMPDLFSRMQASSKAATLGSVCLIIAAAAHFGGSSIWFRAAALGGFLFLTAPIAAHLTARAGFMTGVTLADETIIDEAIVSRAREVGYAVTRRPAETTIAGNGSRRTGESAAGEAVRDPRR